MRSPVMIVLLAIVFLLFAVYMYRFILRIIDLTKLDRKKRWVRLVVALISALILFTAFAMTGYGIVILAHILVIAWIVDGIHALVKRIRGKKEDNRKWECIYKSGLIPLVLTVLILSYGFFNMKNVVETDYQLTINKTIREEGYTIAMISDLHYPVSMNGKDLETYCNEISSKNPDFVVLCGDIVDEQTSYKEMQEALRILGQIKTQYGIYYVYGNHDKARYATVPLFSTSDLDNALKSNGIQTLEDDVTIVNNEIAIVGRADYGYGDAGGRAKLEDLLMQVDQQQYVVVLDHQPKELKENAALGVDLHLSGHTHAGQLWPGGLIGEWSGANEQNYGLREYGEMDSIVSAGIAGWGSCFRTSKHSEYVIMNLKTQ